MQTINQVDAHYDIHTMDQNQVDAHQDIQIMNQVDVHQDNHTMNQIDAHQLAYQSLACETAINTDFSELFSLKRIYVKYKNAILSLIDCFFRT